MDTRNYNEPSNCGLERCECSEDDKCGCTFPNNVSGCNCTPDDHCGCLASKKETVTRVVKDSVCVCSPKECSCTVERSETDK